MPLGYTGPGDDLPRRQRVQSRTGPLRFHIPYCLATSAIFLGPDTEQADEGAQQASVLLRKTITWPGQLTEKGYYNNEEGDHQVKTYSFELRRTTGPCPMAGKRVLMDLLSFPRELVGL